MIAGQKDYRLAHSILMGVVGLAMLAGPFHMALPTTSLIDAAKISRLSWARSQAKSLKRNRLLITPKRRQTKNSRSLALARLFIIGQPLRELKFASPMTSPY